MVWSYVDSVVAIDKLCVISLTLACGVATCSIAMISDAVEYWCAVLPMDLHDARCGGIVVISVADALEISCQISVRPPAASLCTLLYNSI